MLKPFRCVSANCRQDGHSAKIQHLADGASCLYCGHLENLVALEEIHLLIPAPVAEGAIPGSQVAGTAHLSWDFACKKSKEGFKAGPRDKSYPQNYSTEVAGCTCFNCLQTAKTLAAEEKAREEAAAEIVEVPVVVAEEENGGSVAEDSSERYQGLDDSDRGA